MIAQEAAMTSAIDDEWWTTEIVCAHLKLSKRALWDLRAHPTKAFPVAIKPGGKINLFRAAEVRAWMSARARPGGRSEPQAATSLEVSLPTTEHLGPNIDEAGDRPVPLAVHEAAPAPEKMKRSPRTAPRHAKDARQLDLF
jgi:predicted DNA-binding transcriptional regulator AlpA